MVAVLAVSLYACTTGADPNDRQPPPSVPAADAPAADVPVQEREPDGAQPEPAEAPPDSAASDPQPVDSESGETDDEPIPPSVGSVDDETGAIAEDVIDPVAIEPAADSASDSEIEPESPFEVTEDVYRQTFDEVELVIQRLNDIIRRRDFDLWQTYLTSDYRSYISDTDNLAEMSNSPVLRNRNISLLSARDYFENVVVPSRANLRLDEIVFVNDDVVQAFMVIRDQRANLYTLVRVDDQWKITLF